MATDIDRRVVQMEFDNKDFEKNCKQSLSTLEKLKMALNFDGAKGLKDVGEAAKKVDLSHISKGAEEVRAKFSVMQIAGMTAISELTKGLLNFGKSIWSNTFGQMARGGMARTLKIDQARFQMKALANNFDEIAGDAKKLAYFMEQMHQSIDKSVSGTAYGYDAAAAVASQLMASGIKNTETMYNHLRAIAGAASMTGRSFEDIGNIFTTVASNGRLMTMQLRQFSAAGLNLSATLAKDLGKTEKEINDLVHDGKISFEQFSKALYNAFGEAAGKADETWSGVTANVKAQLSRIGQIFTDPLVEKLIPVLASLKGVLKQVNTVLKPMQNVFRQVLKSITDSMKKTLDNLNVARLKTVANAIENIFASVFLVLKAVKDAFAEMFPKKTSDELYNAARNFELITQSLIPTKETLNGIKNTFKMLLIPARLVYNLFRALSESAIKPIAISLLKFIGAIARLINTLEPFITALTNTIIDSKFFNAILLTIAGTIIIVINILTELTNVASRVFNKLFGNSATKQFLSGIQSIAKFLQDVIILGLVTIFAILQKIFSYINVDTIISIFEGIGRVLNFFIYLIQNAISSIGQLAKGAAESGSIIGYVISAIKNAVEALIDVFKGEDASEHLTKIKEALAGVGNGVKNLIKGILDSVKDIDAGKLILLAFGAAIVFLVIQIAMFFRAGTLLVRSVNGITGILTKFKNAFLGIGRISPVAQLLFSLSLTIGVLTAALVTLSSDVDTERLKTAGIVLGTLVGVLMGFSIAMARFTAVSPKAFDLGISSFIVLMAAIAGSLYMLTSALKTLSNLTINWEKFISPLIAVISLMVAMGGVIIGIATLAGPVEGQFAIGAVSILAFAAAIAILAGVLVELTKADLFSKAADAIMALISIIFLLGTLSAAIATVALAGGSFGSGIAMIGIAVSLLILISVLKKLADTPTKQIEDGFKRLIMMCVPILGFIIAMGVITRIVGTIGFLSGIGGTFAGLTLLLISLVSLTMILGSSNIAKMAIGIMALSAISRILINLFMSIISSLYAVNPAAIATAQVYMRNLKGFIIGLGAAMLMIGIAARIMTGVNFMAIVGCGVLLEIIGNIAIRFVNVSKETEHAKVGPIIAMIFAIITIVGALAILSFQDPWNVLAAGGGLALALIGLAFVIAAMAKTSRNVNTIIAGTSKTFPLAKVAAIVVGITALIMIIVSFLNEMTKETTSAASSDVAEQLAALAAANGSNVQSSSSTDWTKYGKIGILIGAAIGIVIISILLYKWLDKISKTSTGNITQLLATVASVLAILVMAVGSISILSLVADQLKDPTNIMMAGFSLLLVMAGFASIMWGLSKLPAINTMNMIQVGIGLTIAASAVLVLALALIPLAILLNSDESMYVGLSVSFMTLTLAVFSLSICLTMLLRSSHGVSKVAVLNASIAMVIAASSLIAIAAAIGGLAYILKTVDVGGEHLLGSVISIGVISAVIFTALYGMTKLAARYSTNRVLAAAASMVIASSVFIVIGGAIALIAYSMKNVTVLSDKAFKTAMDSFIVCVIGIGVIFAVLAILSNKIDPTNLLLASVSFAILAGSIGIIGAAVAGIIAVSKTADAGAIDNAIKMFDKVLILFGVLAGAGAVLGMLGGFGTMVISGVYLLSGAFVILAAAVFILTEAAENLVNAVDIIVKNVEKLNSIELNHDILTKNIAELKKITPEIVSIFTNAIHEINVGIGTVMYEITNVGASFVTGFLKGVNQQLPEILDTFLQMMKTVGEYLTNDENRKIIVNFCKSIATVLYDVIVGTLASIFEEISDEILKLKQEYYEEDKKHMQEKSNKKIAQNAKINFLDYYSVLDADSVNDQIDDIIEEVKKRNPGRAAALEKEVNNNPLFIPDYEDLSEQQKKDIITAIELRKTQGIEDGKVFNDLIANMKNVAEYSGIAFDSEEVMEYGRKMSKLVGISDLFEEKEGVVRSAMKKAQKATEDAADSTEDYANKINDAAVKTEEASEKAANATKDAADEIKDSAKEVENTDIFSGIIKKGTELFGGSGDFLSELKEKAKGGLESFTGFFGNIGDAFGEELGVSFGEGAFENCDLTDFFNKVLSDGITEADIAGLAAGDRYANSFFESQEQKRAFYYEQANKKVATNGSAFSKKSYWATLTDEKGNQLYKSADDYVNKQMELDQKYDATSETLNSLGVSYDDVTKAMEEFDLANGNTADSMDETKDKAKDLAKTLHDQVKDAMKNIFDDPGEEDFIDTDEMLYRMEENIRRVGKWARQLSELAAKGISEGLLNELREMGPAGAAKVDAFARMTADQLQEANRLYLDSTAMPNEAVNKIMNSYKEAGFNASLGFAKGIDPDAANDAMIDLANNGLDSLTGEEGLDEESPSKKTYAIGEYATEGLANGLVDNAQLRNVHHKAEVVTKRIIHAFESSLKESKAIELAKNFCNGLILGLQSEGQRIVTYATVLASAIKRAFEIKLRISSPSKEMAEIGKYIMMGVGVGMEDGSTFVERQTNQSAEDIINSMKENFANSLEGIGEDGVYSPVIRPIFDMTLAGQGWNDITSWFNGGQMVNLDSNISRLTPTTDDASNNADIINAIKGIDVNGVKNEIQAMRSDISTLQSAMSNLQVVMNTGALVGQLLNPLDAAMGQKAMLNSRGRY